MAKVIVKYDTSKEVIQEEINARHLDKYDQYSFSVVQSEVDSHLSKKYGWDYIQFRSITISVIEVI